jgi:hypothetical protein
LVYSPCKHQDDKKKNSVALSPLANYTELYSDNIIGKVTDKWWQKFLELNNKVNYIVTCPLKARTVEPEERAVTLEQLSKLLSLAIDMHATIENQSGDVFLILISPPLTL